MKTFKITFLLFLTHYCFLAQINNKVNIDKNKLTINNKVVIDSSVLFFNDIECFKKAFNEKPKKYKNKTANLYYFYFLNSGCYVSHNSKKKTKKSFPSEITFHFNFDSRYIPYHNMKMFSEDFYINELKINSATTFSDFDIFKNDCKLNNGSIEFNNFHIEFDETLKNSKIVCIKYNL